MNKKNIFTIIIILAIVGIGLSAYLLNLHYSKLSSPCDLSEGFSCSLVNRSEYSQIFGIPVALLGLIGYFLIGSMSWLLKSEKKFLPKVINVRNLFGFSILALLISLYLTYAEIFLIKAICILCVISQINIIVITILLFNLIKRGN